MRVAPTDVRRGCRSAFRAAEVARRSAARARSSRSAAIRAARAAVAASRRCCCASRVPCDSCCCCCSQAAAAAASASFAAASSASRCAAFCRAASSLAMRAATVACASAARAVGRRCRCARGSTDDGVMSDAPRRAPSLSCHARLPQADGAGRPCARACVRASRQRVAAARAPGCTRCRRAELLQLLPVPSNIRRHGRPRRLRRSHVPRTNRRVGRLSYCAAQRYGGVCVPRGAFGCSLITEATAGSRQPRARLTPAGKHGLNRRSLARRDERAHPRAI